MAFTATLKYAEECMRKRAAVGYVNDQLVLAELDRLREFRIGVIAAYTNGCKCCLECAGEQVGDVIGEHEKARAAGGDGT